jgi:hypothetical protein
MKLATVTVQTGLLCVLLAGAAGAADPSYTPSGALPAGRSPSSFAIADVNGDSHPDLAIANQDSDDLTVLLGDGVGGFSAAPGSPVAAGDAPFGVAAADLSGDRKVDLAVSNNSSNALRVLLGNGAGGFTAASGSPILVDGSPGQAAAADLDGDGDIDLAVPVWQNNWRVAILLGDGAGGFAQAPGSPIAVGGRYGTARISLADLNSDGKVDLIIARSEAKVLSILLGSGGGRFGAPTTVASGYGPSAIAVADLNRDRRPDLAVGTLYSDRGGPQAKLATLLGDGSGGFRRAPGSPMRIPGMPTSVAAADLDADGRLDLAVATSHPDPDGIAILLGNGTGRFRPALDSPFALLSPTQVEAAELNGDGRFDLAVASPNGVRVLWRTASTPAIARGHVLSGRPDILFTTRGLITKLAADGNRAAVKTTARSSRSCGRIVVWTAPGRKSKSFSTSNPGCGSILCPKGSGCVDELALGGGQVAWISRSGGNNLELMVIAARLAGGKPRLVEFVANGNGAGGDIKGGWVGNLLGAGSVLAYNGWSIECEVKEQEDCDMGRASLRATDERVVRLRAGRRAVVKRGTGSRPLSAVGGGRMAVEAGGAITTLAPNGSRVASVPTLAGNPPRGVALSRTHLAVLRTFTLDLYNPARGTTTKSIPLGPAAALRLVGVNSRLALLRGARRLVLVRLSDGKLISLPITTSRAASIVDARLTEAGLFYAYNVRRPAPRGRIVFQPSARLLARF